MAGLRDEKKQALHKAIYDTATDLFEREGYDAISVGRITSEVGIAKGTFFNHFPAKADILAEWYRRLMTDSVQLGPESADPLDRLVELAAAPGRRAANYPELWRAKAVEAPRSAHLQQVESEFDNRLVSMMTSELDKLSPGETSPSSADIADTLLAIGTGTWREAIIANDLSEVEARLRRRFAVVLSASRLAKPSGTP